MRTIARDRRRDSLMLSHGPMSQRLLVHVDDDADLAFLLERALSVSGLANWDFKYVQGGPAALEYLGSVRAGSEARPTLLLLDIKMPVVNGLDVLAWMSENMPEIPVLMLSSSELLSDRLRARDLGSRGYFSKAAIFTDLLEFLRAWDETAFATRPRVLAPETVSDPPSN